MSASRKRGLTATRLTVVFSNDLQKEMAMTVVSYEALVRDVPKGLACYELVMEAIDLESYPRELRERLADIEEELSDYSLARALKKLDRGDSGAREPSPGARKGAANG